MSARVSSGQSTARASSGQSLVELALIAPLLIVLAMAAWDGGGALREQVVLDQAARDGARVAATGYAGSGSPTTADVCAAVTGSAADLTGLTCGASNITYAAGVVQVQLTYAHPLITPVLRQLWSGGQGNLTLRASASFFVPSLTPVPGTVVPSTPTPTPTPSPTPSPTSVPTATPSPTPAAEFTCDNSLFTPHTVAVPQLAAGSGSWVSFNVPAGDWIVVTWYVSPYIGLRVGLYQGSPPGVTTFSAGQANLDNAIVVISSAPTSTAGVYSAYFFNPTNTPFRSTSTASIGCT